MNIREFKRKSKNPNHVILAYYVEVVGIKNQRKVVHELVSDKTEHNNIVEGETLQYFKDNMHKYILDYEDENGKVFRLKSNPDVRTNLKVAEIGIR